MNLRRLEKLELETRQKLVSEFDRLQTPLVDRINVILTDPEIEQLVNIIRAHGDVENHPAWRKVVADPKAAGLVEPLLNFYSRVEKRGLAKFLETKMQE